MKLGVVLPLQIFGSFRKIGVNCSLNVLYNYLVKPSGPGLLFVGNFQITVAILVLVIHLLIFSISSWFSLGRLYLSKNLSISSRLSVLLAYSYFSSLSWSFVISGMSCCTFFFISNCIDLTPLPFFSRRARFINSVYLLK